MLNIFNTANYGGASPTAFIHSDQPYNLSPYTYTGAVLSVTAFPNNNANNTGYVLKAGTGYNNGTGFNPYLVVTAKDGKVGIGTSSPGFPLNFANAIGDKIALWGNSGGHYGFGIQSGLLQIHTDGSASDVVFGYGSSASFTETMRIKGNGAVGIGVTAPVQKLEVNGSVKSTGLIVTDGVNKQFQVLSTGYVRARDITVDALAIPDYVFEKNYNLNTLQEVEAFIKQHKHLPGIPSAKEIEKEGMSVSQMQSKLLEKVEELTLHLIQHETEILKLKEENERLKAVIGNR